MIELHDLTVGYGERTVLRDVSLDFPPGQVTVLLGPNGCGKSTLMKTALGLLPRQGGEVLYDGVDLERLTTRQVARKAAYLPQSREVPSITARRMVLHGRFPYLGYPRRYRAEDYEAAAKALEWAGAGDLADRPVRELSGGQRQKVYLAMALAQDTDLILLDEPTTYLDPGRQFELLDLIASLPGRGKTVVMVLHDLSHALRYSTQLLLLEQGRLVQRGTPEELYAGGQLDRVFGIRSRRAPDGSYYFLPPFA